MIIIYELNFDFFKLFLKLNSFFNILIVISEYI